MTGSPRHQPWRSGRGATAMGLRPLQQADWLEPGADTSEQMNRRDLLLKESRDDVAFCPGDTLLAGQEILERVIGNLASHHCGHYQMSGDSALCRTTGRQVTLDRNEPLITAARLVQEDFCLLRPGDDGYRLAAAVVCFPSRWSLADKVRQPLSVIHGPVPGYDHDLARPVDRFFEMLKPDRQVWRANWSLHRDPELFQPAGSFRRSVPAAPDIPDGVWIRVERQCMARLDTGDVLFTIRTFTDPLTSIRDDRDSRHDMARSLAEMPQMLQDYKNISGWSNLVIDWLNNT